VAGGDIDPLTATVAVPEDTFSWELRAAWAKQRTVRLSLDDRCVIRRVLGRVERVAASGAFVVVDGWHVPIDAILAVGHPLEDDVEAYEDEKREALERGRQEGWF
jgi:hypothetical protein